jgi:hypothetical protein
VLFHHNGQTDVVLTLPNTDQGSFTVPSSGLDSLGNIQYEVRLTVTDTDGLTDTASVLLDPERVDITLGSVPAGLDLTLDSVAGVSPYTVSALVGYQYQVGAPNAGAGTDVFTFNSWSDGGAQFHTIVAPSIPNTYVATYDVTTIDPAADEDGDGLLNGWESQFGLDPLDPNDAGLDGDNDGLTNFEEQSLGTEPNNPDTDGDGATDGAEVAAGTDPLDAASTPDLNDPDLVGWYHFDADDGGLIADGSGNGNDGGCTVGGTCPSYVGNDGQPPGAYDFAGSVNYVEISNEAAFDFVNTFSVTLWMKTNDLGGTWAQLVGKGDSAWSLNRTRNSNSLQFTTWDPAVDQVRGSADVADGQWHHVAVVYDGAQKVLYVDGQIDAQRAYSGQLSNNDFRVHLGYNAEETNAEYSGLLDDVRIYKRALSQTEIQQISAEALP